MPASTGKSAFEEALDVLNSDGTSAADVVL
jgi:hypothetical protein